jgi:hypothetical protein
MFKNFFSVNRAVYELMCENMVLPDRPHLATSYSTEKMQFECGIPKVKIQTHIHDI